MCTDGEFLTSLWKVELALKQGFPQLMLNASVLLQVLRTDPVCKLALAPMLKENLNTCASLHGDAAFNAAMARLHPSLLKQLEQVLLS